MLGARSDAGLVRQGTAQASVTASFDVPSGHPAYAILAEAGIEAEPNEPLLIRRLVRADGGSRAHVNGQPAAAGLLRALGAGLVEVHGQHDDRGLLNPRGHRALLDVFANADVGAVAASHLLWREAEAKLDQAATELESATRDRDWLAHMVEELHALAPEPGEEAALAEARATMQKGARLSGELAAVTAQLDGSDGALSGLRQAARRLDRLAPEHPLLADALAALDRAVIEASEAEDRLAEASRALTHEPADLDRIETRLFDLRALARKHRVEPDGLAALATELAARLERIDAGGEGIVALDKAATAARAAYLEAADALGVQRRAAATRLDAAVAAELAPLKLDAARFRTTVELLTEAQWGPAGRDRVEFEIATNPGAPFAPLAKIASGGELSRFILALKGGARGGGRRGDDGVRRGRSWRRRSGRGGDRRAIGSSGGAGAVAGGDA